MRLPSTIHLDRAIDFARVLRQVLTDIVVEFWRQAPSLVTVGVWGVMLAGLVAVSRHLVGRASTAASTQASTNTRRDGGGRAEAARGEQR